MIVIWILLIIILLSFLAPVQTEVQYEYHIKSKYIITVKLFYGLIRKTIDSEKNVLKSNKENRGPISNPLDLTQYLIDKGDIRDLYLKVNIGTVDPVLLGITVGVIWALINIFFTYFFRHKNLNDIGQSNIQVMPLFDKDIFKFYFSCIIRINLVYIIIVYLKHVNNKKGGDSIARASHRRIDANYNE